jgi:hypothetical protein
VPRRDVYIEEEGDCFALCQRQWSSHIYIERSGRGSAADLAAIARLCHQLI